MEEKKKILIVEDEASIAELEKDYLELSGFQVETEGDGEKGLKKALEGNYDLLILDLMLPGRDGFSITQEVRSKKDIPILLVSARRDDIDKIRGLGLGADDYMTKPFSASELVARVKAHLARYTRLRDSGKEENEIIEIRGLKIDTTARRVFVNGEEVPFTSREFDLLAFLAAHPNRVYTKEELFQEIWKMESIGDIATVTVHIKKLREKIEMENAVKPQYIETIWGVGYRFKALKIEKEFGKENQSLSLPDKIVCTQGTLSLASPRRGSKLLQDKSQEPMGSDYPAYKTILQEA